MAAATAAYLGASLARLRMSNGSSKIGGIMRKVSIFAVAMTPARYALRRVGFHQCAAAGGPRQ
jgi:hypothetical protein